MRISDWSSDVCSSDLFVGHVGSHRGNLSEENPALYRRRGCLTCFVAGTPPGTGSGGGVTVFETTPLVLSKREKRRCYALSRKVTGPWLTRLTTFWAPTRPVPTPGGCFFGPLASTRGKTRSAYSGPAPVLKPD